MYFLKRAAFMLPLLLLISVLAFALLRAAPGGPGVRVGGGRD